MQMFVLGQVPYIFNGKTAQRFLIMMPIILYLAAVLFVFLNFADNRLGYLPYRFWPLVDTPA
jgi:hypothetical protein